MYNNSRTIGAHDDPTQYNPSKLNTAAAWQLKYNNCRTIEAHGDPTHDDPSKLSTSIGNQVKQMVNTSKLSTSKVENKKILVCKYTNNLAIYAHRQSSN